LGDLPDPPILEDVSLVPSLEPRELRLYNGRTAGGRGHAALGRALDPAPRGDSRGSSDICRGALSDTRTSASETRDWRRYITRAHYFESVMSSSWGTP